MMGAVQYSTAATTLCPDVGGNILVDAHEQLIKPIKYFGHSHLWA